MDGQVDGLICESDLGCVLSCAPVVELSDPGPVYSSKAHRARFTGRVDLTALKVPSLEFGAGLADSRHLSMGGGVIP